VEVTTDEELIAAMASGDRDAVAMLYRRHAPWVGGRLAGMTSSRDLAEEALQDTFVSAWRGAGSFKGSGPVPAWLWGIARRRLVDLARRQRGPSTLMEEKIDASPEEIVLGLETNNRVHAAVAKLPDDQRAAIEAVVFEGRSLNETARAMGVAEGTVKSRLHRARARIREALE
jgi:RNA polymerase sigma-70 factor, ECF subfamily